MTGTLSKLGRAQFLRGKFKGGQPAARPPWALAEDAFLEMCSRCDACVGACPEGIIQRGRGGYPEVSFAHGACTFCEACVAACAPGALVRGSTSAPWTLRAVISSACLSAAGVTCRVCGEQCETSAIRFALAVGGVATPAVDATSCTGCGACVAPCPVAAIEVH
jgi:ferredoxin-type protein NapF